MTAAEPPELPAGELSLVGSELLLCDRFHTEAFAGYRFAAAGEQLLVMLSLEGRVNQSTERKTVTVVIRPETAQDLAVDLLAAQIAVERHAAQTGGDRS